MNSMNVYLFFSELAWVGIAIYTSDLAYWIAGIAMEFWEAFPFDKAGCLSGAVLCFAWMRHWERSLMLIPCGSNRIVLAYCIARDQ
jgi:hypothetical protein